MTFWEDFNNGFTDYLADKITERMEAKKARGEDVSQGPSIFDGYAAFFNDSFDTVNQNVLEPVKRPIRNGARSLDRKVRQYIDDGNPDNMTFCEKAWNGFKGLGKFVDNYTNSETFVALGTVYLGAGAISEILPEAWNICAANVLTTGCSAVGGYCTGNGAYHLVTADNEQEAQYGGYNIGNGIVSLYFANQSAKPTLLAAQRAGICVKNPENISSCAAIIENGRILPQTLKKAATFRKASGKPVDINGKEVEATIISSKIKAHCKKNKPFSKSSDPSPQDNTIDLDKNKQKYFYINQKPKTEYPIKGNSAALTFELIKANCNTNRVPKELILLHPL